MTLFVWELTALADRGHSQVVTAGNNADDGRMRARAAIWYACGKLDDETQMRLEADLAQTPRIIDGGGLLIPN